MVILVLLVLLVASAALAVWSRYRARAEQADHRPSESPARRASRRRRGLRGRLGLFRRRPVETGPDPFDVLTVQEQLSRLAALIRTLDEDPAVWAKGRRMIATQAAYDAVLTEACRMAGITLDVPLSLPLNESERFREEIELASRGWAW